MPKPRQHLSHRNLVKVAAPAHATDARIDAIVVPSARPARSLTEAAWLASELGRPLVVLCSRASKRERVIAHIARITPDVTVLAIDLPPKSLHPALAFRSTSIIAGTAFDRTTDTSLKRNLGLLLARSLGWHRILFIDDDISIPDARDIRRAVGSAGDYAAVGLRIGGFPDNSVVCHAIRETGGEQDTFIGGGALVVNVDAPMSFFPNIYNEDWFFLLDEAGLRPLAGTDHVAAFQRPFDPFASPIRAIQEEFGDVLAEGVFALLDEDGKVGDADLFYWEKFLASRGDLIDDLIRRTRERSADGAQPRMLASLTAARASLAEITARGCVEYLETWRDDLLRWQRDFAGAPSGLALRPALDQIGCAGRWTNRQGTGSSRPRPASSYLDEPPLPCTCARHVRSVQRRRSRKWTSTNPIRMSRFRCRVHRVIEPERTPSL